MPRRSKDTQPIRAPTGGDYGARQQLESAQRAVPLPANRGNGGGGGGQAQPPPMARPNVTGPTQRPGEPLTAGAMAGPGPAERGMLPDDPVHFLRAILVQHYSPGLARLLERAGGMANAQRQGIPAPPTAQTEAEAPEASA